MYIFWFLHQTTTCALLAKSLACCISFDSYIKPQRRQITAYITPVVYLLIPTSNHNLLHLVNIFIQLYIFWFLHQTTTGRRNEFAIYRCISFDSYIKPQLEDMLLRIGLSCISFDSYIKPQHKTVSEWSLRVVYLLIPTSNHNLRPISKKFGMLYIFWFLHQTTTLGAVALVRHALYIFWFLHQTTTLAIWRLLRQMLYIFWFLHQTTTSFYM